VTLELTIADDAWLVAGHDDDPHARLLTVLRVNGCDLHLEAWAVEVDRDGVQRHPQDDEGLGALHAAIGAGGHFDTVEIAGRAYVLLATPFC
jgi:hypothetical protein